LKKRSSVPIIDRTLVVEATLATKLISQIGEIQAEKYMKINNKQALMIIHRDQILIIPLGLLLMLQVSIRHRRVPLH